SQSGTEVVVADSADPATIDAMVASTRVLIHLAGPYARHGEGLVRACVRHGTHYIDLTGEMNFVAGMIAAHHRAAEQAGVKIVHSAGFEALPFDLCVLACVRRLGEELATATRSVDLVLTSEAPAGVGPKDALSGGTVNTMRETLAAEPAPGVDDPALLIEERDEAAAVRRHSPLEVGAWHDREFDEFIAPLVPSPYINPMIIHRSASLWARAGRPYGARLRYREGTRAAASARPRLATRLSATVASGAHRSMFWVMTRSAGARALLLALVDRFGPRTGEGPSERALAQWRYRIDAHAEGESGARVWLRLEGDAHPGYRSTARMIVEAGLSLAFDEGLPPIYGVVTPASALGLPMLARLVDAGITTKFVGEGVHS
ncbi:MAG: saccharopine dehydrogenase NADP-binding domain-containing protein, partial [Myxococcales bacterium]|nr:saccharopine dehydrogenase NADP-binding domain-containing protein [Myxococcales bacterium]